MAVSATSGSARLSVEPGSSTTLDVTLRNDGPTAETVHLEVTGPAGPFSFLIPDTVTLEPGSGAAVRVGFRVPRTSVPAAGPLDFKLVTHGPQDTVVTEGTVEVERFCALSATLDPPDAYASKTSRHEVSVGNRGNAPVRIELAASPVDGLDVRIDPSVVAASPDHTAKAAVEVTARRRPFTGAGRTTSFTIVATPDVGPPIEVVGRLCQRAAVAPRTLLASGAAVGAAVLALVLGLTAFSGSDRSPSRSASPAPGGETVASAPTNASCPAAGHLDVRGASGHRPEDIPLLPNTYSFLDVKADGCSPVRFNPCEPIHYIQDLALAPPTGAADVREAFNRLSRVTGLTFVDDGTTEEEFRPRRSYVPERYPGRWAPILVSWMHFPNQGNDPTIQSVGAGIGTREGEMLVSGFLMLNVDAVTNKETRTPVKGGFGPEIGTGTGAIGPENVTWGRIILHELAHVIGLGHTRDKGAIMYPESAEQTSRPADYREPDKAGLRYLGREAGCLTTPPLPSG